MESRRRYRHLLAAAAFGFSLASVARAEPTAAEVAVARKAFADAAALEQAKQWPEAEAKLREALAIKETPGLRYHLGFCLEHQAKLVEALVEYDRADEMLRQGVKAPDVSELVGPARDGVKKRVANVTLKAAAPVEGMHVEIDGTAVKAALVGKSLPQNPGKRVITAGAPGRQPFRRELELSEGEAREVILDLPATSAAAAPGKPATPASSKDAGAGSASASLDSGKPSSTRTYVLVGEAAVTVLALGAGVYFTLEKGKSQDSIDAANAELQAKVGSDDSVCAGSPPQGARNACGQLGDLTEQRDQQKNLALAGFIGAGVGAAATVVTFLAWKPAAKREAAVRVTPVAMPRTFGLGVFGRF